MNNSMTAEKPKRDSRLFGILQRVGRSFMLPIALLPIAGLLLGIGSSLTNTAMISAYHLEKILGPGTVANSVLTVLSDVGSIIFANLPILLRWAWLSAWQKTKKPPRRLPRRYHFSLCMRRYTRC